MAGLDLQVFEGPAHLDPEVKRGPALKKNISLYPVTLISPWKWGADLNSQGPSSTSATKLSVRLRDHEIVWPQLSVEFNHWWRQNKSCQIEGWVFKIKYIENTGKLNNSFILRFLSQVKGVSFASVTSRTWVSHILFLLFCWPLLIFLCCWPICSCIFLYDFLGQLSGTLQHK